MKGGYFWNGETVIFEPGWLNFDTAQRKNLCEMPCVDTHETNAIGRYGMFLSGDGWEDCSLESFPKAFRMHLLLLGVA